MAMKIEFGYWLLIICKRLNNAHEDKVLHETQIVRGFPKINHLFCL